MLISSVEIKSYIGTVECGYGQSGWYLEGLPGVEQATNQLAD